MNTKIITRLCVLLVAMCASSVAFGQGRDCSEPLVTFGEVNAGLHAGFTGGIPNSNTLPSGHFLASAGIEQRGFISPDPFPNGPTGWLCEADWGLVSGWAGARLEWFAGESQARRKTLKLVQGLVTDIKIEVDGVQLEVVETAARWAVQPELFDDTAQVLKSWGAFIEPYSLVPGPHTATIKYSVDLDCLPDFGGECDGIPEFVDDPFSYEFEVAAD